MTHALVRAVREGLAARADADRAPGMQQYMKSELPFRGVPAPVGARLHSAVLRDHPLRSRAEWEDVVRELYDGAGFREERYAALAVLRARGYRAWLDADTAGLFSHLIVAGAWWDLVDDVSATAGTALQRDRTRMTRVVQGWAVDDDLWLRRASIICQRKARAETDVALLAYAIEHSIGDRDFFARKAIGWALREHSKTDADWARSFVDAHPGLSALSRREGLRWLERGRSASSAAHR